MWKRVRPTGKDDMKEAKRIEEGLKADVEELQHLVHSVQEQIEELQNHHVMGTLAPKEFGNQKPDLSPIMVPSLDDSIWSVLDLGPDSPVQAPENLKRSDAMLLKLGGSPRAPLKGVLAQILIRGDKIVSVNDEFAVLTRCTKSSVIGQTLSHFIPPAFTHWYSYVLDHILMSSDRSSILFEGILSRSDQTLFRSVQGFDVFYRNPDESDPKLRELRQTVFTVYINTVHDLDTL